MAPHQTQVHALLNLQKSAINKYCVIKSMTYTGNSPHSMTSHNWSVLADHN